jgi:hypothetical protein
MTNLTHNSFSICLFQCSTCFEQPRARHQENQLYQYVWYVSFCVGDHLVCHLHTVTYNQMLYRYNWFSWWWARGCSKHVENWNKHIEKELCIKLVIYKSYTEMPARSAEQKIRIVRFSFWFIQEVNVVSNFGNPLCVCVCVWKTKHSLLSVCLWHGSICRTDTKVNERDTW